MYNQQSYQAPQPRMTYKKIASQKNLFSGIIDKTKVFIHDTISDRQGCKCQIGLKNGQTCGKAYEWLYQKYKKEDKEKLEQNYQNILKQSPNIDKNVTNQIQKDLNRTFPSQFRPDCNMLNQLQNVLYAYAVYDAEIGYVQGMNFIVASLLYHSEEYIAFWLLIIIFDTLQMRDIYQPELPGLSKHIQMIDLCTFTHLHTLYSHFCNNNITIDMLCTPWIFSLLGVVVSIDTMGSIFENVLQQGWSFIYKLVVVFLLYHQEELLEYDQSEILEVLTAYNYQKQENNEENQQQTQKWSEFIESAKNFEINSTLNNQDNKECIQIINTEKNQNLKKEFQRKITQSSENNDTSNSNYETGYEQNYGITEANIPINDIEYNNDFCLSNNNQDDQKDKLNKSIFSSYNRRQSNGLKSKLKKEFGVTFNSIDEKQSNNSNNSNNHALNQSNYLSKSLFINEEKIQQHPNQQQKINTNVYQRNNNQSQTIAYPNKQESKSVLKQITQSKMQNQSILFHNMRNQTYTEKPITYNNIQKSIFMQSRQLIGLDQMFCSNSSKQMKYIYVLNKCMGLQIYQGQVDSVWDQININEDPEVILTQVLNLIGEQQSKNNSQTSKNTIPFPFQTNAISTEIDNKNIFNNKLKSKSKYTNENLPKISDQNSRIIIEKFKNNNKLKSYGKLSVSGATFFNAIPLADSEKINRSKGTIMNNQCEICFQECTNSTLFRCNQKCQHYFCQECIVTYIVFQIFSGQVLNIQCPKENCEKLLTDEDISLFVEPEIYEKYKKFKLKRILDQNPNVRWCTQINCSRFLLKEQQSNNEKYLKCKCGQMTCFNCAEEAHEGLTCEQNFQKIFQHNQEKYKIIKCPTCKSKLQKMTINNQMCCFQCKNEICYLCLKTCGPYHYKEWNIFSCAGAQYKLKKPNTCSNFIKLFFSLIRDFILFLLCFILFLTSLGIYYAVVLFIAPTLPYKYDEYKTGDNIFKYTKLEKETRYRNNILLGIFLYPIWVILLIIPGSYYISIYLYKTFFELFKEFRNNC